MNERKKVLFLIHTLGGGGAERVLVDTVSTLDPLQYDITVMTVIDTGIYRSSLPKYVTYKSMLGRGERSKKQESILQNSDQPKASAGTSGSLMAKGGFIRRFVARLYLFAWRHINVDRIHKQFIGDIYDVEIAFLEGVCVKIISHAKPNVRKLAWVHTDIMSNGKASAFFASQEEENAAYATMDKIACVSDEVQAAFLKRFSDLADKTFIVHNIINADSVIKRSVGAEDLRDRYKGQGTLLCSVGRLALVKGIDRLMRCLVRLHDAGCHFTCLILGDGPERASAERIAQDGGIAHCVYFLGYQTNPYPYIAASDLYVCASRVEGYSTTVTEALVLGVPVFTTDCPGMHEQLDKSGAGVIVDNSENALFNGLLNLLKNQHTLEGLQMTARFNSRYVAVQCADTASLQDLLLGELACACSSSEGGDN